MVQELKNIDQIFWDALQIESVAEREVFVSHACGGDERLRQMIQKLIKAQPRAERFLEEPLRLDATAEMAVITEKPGTSIGSYKLLQQIGEGGFGVVFEAEQEQPVRRKVALKVIKPGMDTRAVIARFEAERQALALMDHPNIAKVFDAGTTGAGSHPEDTRQGAESIENVLLHASFSTLPASSGRPYFVMELVQGVPITEYCDQCILTTAERLELFVTVCEAVQHAHQKGVIHRDIKPTNILVATQDGQSAPKIIDFGVAKAINQRLTEQTLATGYAQMIGTPLYMSPEQAELSPLGVDTRSDIYSLGVLLYELLSGTTPFDKDRLHAVSYDELRRIIREEEPPRPSTRLSQIARPSSDSLPLAGRDGEGVSASETAALATTIAEKRRTDPRRLQQTVRGELDWIVMKCLEKDRNRRYESANGLARDIERYLHDEPVQACPPSASYRFGKFARRNMSILAGGSAIAAALLVGLGASTWMYFRATTESARAKAVSSLLQEMLGSADAASAKGADYKVGELLDDFAASLGNQLTSEPDVEADIRATIGRAYRSLKLPEKAQPHFEKAIDLRRRTDGPQSEKLAAILVDGAWNLLDQQRHAEAETQANQALEIYRGRGITGAELFHALEILQHILISAQRDEDAERVTRQALEVARQNVEEFPDEANLLHRYANLKIRQEKFADAEQLAYQSVDMHHRLHGDQHPETAFGLKVLANAQLEQKKLPEAEKSVREALTIFRHQFPADHPNVRDTMSQFRTILEARDDKPGLKELAKEEAEFEMRSGGPGYHVRLAGLLLINNPTADQIEEARRLIRTAIEAYRRAPTDQPGDFRGRMNAADGYVLAILSCVATPGFGDEVAEMSHLLNAELPRLLVDFPDSSQCRWEVAMGYLSLGRVLFENRDYRSTTEQALSESIRILTKYSLSDPNRPYLWVWLAESYLALSEVQRESGRLVEAEATMKLAMEIYIEHEEKIAADVIAEPTPDFHSNIISQHLFCAFRLAANHRDEAAKLVRNAAPITKHLTDPAEFANALHWIALMQLRVGDTAAYRATCRALLDVPVQNADDVARSRPIWTPCLAPDVLDLEDVNLLVKRAEEFVAHNSLGQPQFGLNLLGAVLYRAGQFERAAQVLEESIAVYPADPPGGFDIINTQRLFFAMTKWQLGQRDEASQLLAEILPAIDKELQSPSSKWNRRATLEVLRVEAKALIVPEEADEAVENKTRTSNDPQP